MKVYILLFRAINVGGKNLLPMKALKRFLEGEGYCDVNTYIQSGNVVLKAESKPSQNISLKYRISVWFYATHTSIGEKRVRACFAS